MHELSIAMSISEGGTEEARLHGDVKVNAVHVNLGELYGLANDARLFSYALACEGTALEGSRLVIEEIPVMAFCPRCEIERAPASIQWLSCPVCDAPTPQVAQGKEIEIAALEITE